MTLQDIITPEQLDQFMHPGHEITDAEKVELLDSVKQVQPLVDVYRRCKANHGSDIFGVPVDIELRIIERVLAMVNGAIQQVHATPKN